MYGSSPKLRVLVQVSRHYSYCGQRTRVLGLLPWQYNFYFVLHFFCSSRSERLSHLGLRRKFCFFTNQFYFFWKAFRDRNRNSKFFNHLSAVSEGTEAILWVGAVRPVVYILVGCHFGGGGGGGAGV